MATGESILAYHGDPGLGLGAGAGVSPVPDRSALQGLDDTLKNIMLVNHETNMQLFKQKVADRDQLREALSSGDVEAGNMDENDRKYFNDAKQKLEDYYTNEWKGNMNDVQGYAHYKTLASNLKDISTHGQLRWAMLSKLKNDAAQQTLPWKQKNQLEDYERQSKKPFWDDIDPYQQAFDFTTGKIMDNIKTNTGIVRNGDNGYYYTRTNTDYGATQKAMQAAFLENGETAEDMRQLIVNINKQPLGDLKKTISDTNTRLALYNTQWGDQSGNPAEMIKVDPDGHIADSAVDFATKYAIASQPQFVSQTPNKDMNDVLFKNMKATQGEERINLLRDKNAIERFRANTYAADAKLKTSAFKELNNQEQVAIKAWKDIGGVINFNLGESGINPEGAATPLTINADDLSPEQREVGGMDANGRPIALKPFGSTMVQVEAENGKKTFEAQGGYYIPDLFIPKGAKLPNGDTNRSGKEIKISADQLRQLVQSAGGDVSVEEFLKDQISNGTISFRLKGENGTASIGSMYSSQAAIMGKFAKRGALMPFLMDGDESQGGDYSSDSDNWWQ